MDGRRGADRVLAVQIARLARPLSGLSDAGLAERLRGAERKLRRLEADLVGVVAGETAAAEAAARTLSFEDFALVVRRWEQFADADGVHGDSERAHARRGLCGRTVGHTMFVNARFRSAQGAQLCEVLDAYAQAEFAADLASARAGASPAPTAPRSHPSDGAHPGVMLRRDRYTRRVNVNPAPSGAPATRHVEHRVHREESTHHE